MNKSEEFETCNASRNLIIEFLKIIRDRPGDLDDLAGEKRTEYIKAFAHLEMCYHGYDKPNHCHLLWHQLQSRTSPESGKYDPYVAMFFAEAKRMLKNPKSWPQQKLGVDY